MKKRLVLDLDMTLLYSDNLERESEDGKFEDDGDVYYIWLRPFVKEFLEFCFKNFDVSLCTAAKKGYTLKCLSVLNVLPENFTEILTREDLKKEPVFNGYSEWEDYVKPWSDVLAVDDKDYIYRGSNNKIFRVNPYFPSPKDTELLRIKVELENVLKDNNEI